MAPIPLFHFAAPFLMTTLGIFELTLVYCPIRDHFHLTSLDNTQEDLLNGKLNASVPVVDINILPRELYIHKDVLDCVGSGQPADENTTTTTPTQRIYFAINFTSERLIAVEDIHDATRIHVERSGNNWVIGYNETKKAGDPLKLFKGVIPYSVDDDNVSSINLANSYVTIGNVKTTDDYEVVHLFGKDCVDIDCQP